MTILRAQEGLAAKALEFLILTAARTGETIGARWDEMDLEAEVWTIPASRMKASVEHRVPLSQRAMQIIRTVEKIRQSDYVFPGQKEGKSLTNMAMLELLKRMGKTDLTVHGFRSSFRDWASEKTGFSRDVCEMALAHTIPNQAEAAYRRGDLIEKRRSLMEEWSEYCVNKKR
jgi:integrase